MNSPDFVNSKIPSGTVHLFEADWSAAPFRLCFFLSYSCTVKTCVSLFCVVHFCFVLLVPVLNYGSFYCLLL